MSHPISRRTFLRAAVRTGAVLGAATSIGAGYTMYGEPGWLSVERVSVPIRGLPSALHGVTIAQMSDLHLSEVVSFEHIAHAVRLANAQRPDIMVLTGDYVTHGQDYIAPLARAVAPLHAPLGVFAVLGNHDHWTGNPDRVQAVLADVGINVLRNAHARVAVRDDAIWLAGVDDIWEDQADIATALHGIPEQGLRLLLAHEPDFADVAARYGVHLQLSGHSHGGQVCLPFSGPPILPHLGRRYPSGLRQVPNSTTLVYTNRGIGVVEPAVRFNCRPEITILTLERTM